MPDDGPLAGQLSVGRPAQDAARACLHGTAYTTVQYVVSSPVHVLSAVQALRRAKGVRRILVRGVMPPPFHPFFGGSSDPRP